MAREPFEQTNDGARICFYSAGTELETLEKHDADVRERLTALWALCPVAHETTTAAPAVPPHSADGGLSVPLDECLATLEASLIAWALATTGGNKSRAAELLRIKRTTLADRIVRLRDKLAELDVKTAGRNPEIRDGAASGA